jgi:Secretion system C-terminal sorting domain
VQVINGMGNKNVYSLAYSGNNLFAGTYGFGVYLSTNNGGSWTQTSLNNQNVYSLAANGNNVFAGTADSVGGGVYRTTNNGANWTLVLNNLGVPSLAANGNNIFAGTFISGVYRTTNNGANWTLVFNNQSVFALAANGNNIFAGTFIGVYRTTNNGANWTLVLHNVFAGTFLNGVYRTTNNGTTWTQTSVNNQDVLSLAVSGNNVFAGTGSPTPNGVFVSNDNGANWTQRNEGFPPTIDIHALCIFNNYIFAGSESYGVYRRPLSELIGIKPISNQVPEHFALEQNYPNPFNPATKIRFALPKSSFAKIVIYDALGREVVTLVNEQLKPGTYEADWNATNYPSGVYYYKLTVRQAGSSTGDPSSGSGQVFVETKKMVLIK